MNYEIPEDVSVSLLLTRRCNFKCAHCMYSCGPQVSAKYMTRETIAAAMRGVERLRDLNIRVRVNLIGGEPTLDMAEFERCLLHVSSIEGVDMEMTTNGWWMHKVEDTRRFMDAVRDTLYRKSEGFQIRVSNDKYHDAFRPARLQGKHLVSRLEAIFDGSDEPVFTEEVSCCDNDHEHEGYHEECPTCNSTDIEHTDREVCRRVPDNDTMNGPWIWVEERQTDWGAEIISPHGRAKYFGMNDKAAMIGKCLATDSLTFNPDGTLNDACATGAVEDDPLALLFITQRGVEEAKPVCHYCQEQFAEWRKHHLRAARKEAVSAALAAKPREER